MFEQKKHEFWFITGSQYLYGTETLEQVASDSQKIVENMNLNNLIPFNIVFKPVLKTSDEIRKLCNEANTDENCSGLITWMHTFSPAKMWIAGLSELRKPLLHLHTQFNRDIPWDTIDMDFMNLNQSAHGDREYGFIGARMEIPRKIISGHWTDNNVCSRLGSWMKVAVAFIESRNLKIARFGDNMREVAVTEGDKVEAQIKFGWSVNGYGIGDLTAFVDAVKTEDIDILFQEYSSLYELEPAAYNPDTYIKSIKEQARIELGIKAFLDNGEFGAFTTTFEDLHGLTQLPGLAVQRLMAGGYGFGGEGDWKTSALVRTIKIMAGGTATSFMEDYTYHLEPGNELVLGAHMLEVCPSIAGTKPRIEVHPLGIGGKADPARLVFNGRTGMAVCASLIDLGSRFRLIVNEVESIQVEKCMPRLPVARLLWKPLPSLQESTEAWIMAGGAHHTCISFAVTSEQLSDWAEMMGIECIIIDKNTKLRDFKNELRWNKTFYH
jgi:L-arabinose isomerase